VIKLLTGESKVCFIWAEGDIDSPGLFRVFPYINGKERYYIPQLTRTTKATSANLHYGWVSFEFDEPMFLEMMQDEYLDLEYNRIFVIILEEPLVEKVISTRFEEIGLEWLLKHGAMALSPFRHFEGYYLVGDCDIVGTAVERVRRKILSGD
jgi:hypothetical protein